MLIISRLCVSIVTFCSEIFKLLITAFKLVDAVCIFSSFLSNDLVKFVKSRYILFQRRFTGSCILYAQVVWDQKTIWPWSESSCDFEIYMNLAVNVIFPTLMILFILLFLSPRYDEDYVRRKRIRHLGLDMFYLNDIL